MKYSSRPAANGLGLPPEASPNTGPWPNRAATLVGGPETRLHERPEITRRFFVGVTRRGPKARSRLASGLSSNPCALRKRSRARWQSSWARWKSSRGPRKSSWAGQKSSSVPEKSSRVPWKSSWAALKSSRPRRKSARGSWKCVPLRLRLPVRRPQDTGKRRRLPVPTKKEGDCQCHPPP